MRASFDHRFLVPVFFGLAVAAPLVLAACSASSPTNGFGGGGSDGATTASSSASASVTSGNGQGGDIGFDGGPAGTGSGGAPPTCTPGGPDDDVDKDGFTPKEGDCDDCDPFSNPNAVEVIATDGSIAKDENCDGKIDEAPPPPCDQGLDIADLDPLTVPKAVDLCKVSTGPKDWGVVSATWVLADGTPPSSDILPNFHLGHGLLSAFGANVKVRAGERMLGLSSGTARGPNDPGYQNVGGFNKGYTGNHPIGFPKESPACPGSTTGEPHDPTGVEVKVIAPSNAHGFSFDFDFFTYEWPGFVCNKYNDFFVAILSPVPMGQLDGNISFDSMGNPVSVNNAFLEVCGCEGNPPNPCVAGGKTFTCALGDTDLIGTGFGFDNMVGFNTVDHGSTGWLQTKAPVEPGKELTLRWAVYDSGDGSLDTTTLIDNWKWLATPGITVGTNPVPK